MATLLSISAKKEDLQTSSGSSYISKSGIYPVKINFASVEESKNGATQVNFNFDYNGNAQAIWGPYITNNKGEANKIGVTLINSLGIIIGLGEGEDLTMEQETFKVGKDNKEKEFLIIPEFTEQEVLVRLQEEYSSYNGEIRKSMVIKAFYRAADNASAVEIANNTDKGVQFEKDRKYVDNITYIDTTAEEVEAWKKAKADAANNTSTTKAAPKAAVKPVGSVFLKK